VGAGGFSPPGPVGRASANVEQSTSQRDPQSEEPEAPGSAVVTSYDIADTQEITSW
jgi:hypothetical protein